VTLREEHRLRVFENRVLRRTFGPKRDEVTRGWRKLHNEELHNLYSSPSIIRIRQQIMLPSNKMGTHRQQGDLISLLTKMGGDTQTDAQTRTGTQTDIQGDHIFII
jgi:hypothetical protein